MNVTVKFNEDMVHFVRISEHKGMWQSPSRNIVVSGNTIILTGLQGKDSENELAIAKFHFRARKSGKTIFAVSNSYNQEVLKREFAIKEQTELKEGVVK